RSARSMMCQLRAAGPYAELPIPNRVACSSLCGFEHAVDEGGVDGEAVETPIGHRCGLDASVILRNVGECLFVGAFDVVVDDHDLDGAIAAVALDKPAVECNEDAVGLVFFGGRERVVQ